MLKIKATCKIITPSTIIHGKTTLNDESVEIFMPSINLPAQNTPAREALGIKYQKNNFDDIDQKVSQLKSITLDSVGTSKTHHIAHYSNTILVIICLIAITYILLKKINKKTLIDLSSNFSPIAAPRQPRAISMPSIINN